MHLVDDEYYVTRLLDLLEKSDHSRLELTAELRACDKRGHINEIDLLSAKLIGYVVVCDLLRESLCYRRLTYTGLTDKAGVVLLSSAEYLYNSAKLLLSADNSVKLSVLRALCEVAAVGIKELIFLGLLALILRASRAARYVWRVCGKLALAEELGHIYSGSAALLEIVVIRGDHSLFNELTELVFHRFHLLGCESEMAHHVTEHIIYRYSEILCTLHAKSLVDLIAILKLGHEHDRDTLVAS